MNIFFEFRTKKISEVGRYHFAVFKKDIRTHPKRNEQQWTTILAEIDFFLKI